MFINIDLIKEYLNRKDVQFVVIGWPDVQGLMELEGFYDNAYAITDEDALEADMFYAVSREWLESLVEKYDQQNNSTNDEKHIDKNLNIWYDSLLAKQSDIINQIRNLENKFEYVVKNWKDAVVLEPVTIDLDKEDLNRVVIREVIKQKPWIFDTEEISVIPIVIYMKSNSSEQLFIQTKPALEEDDIVIGFDVFVPGHDSRYIVPTNPPFIYAEKKLVEYKNALKNYKKFLEKILSY